MTLAQALFSLKPEYYVTFAKEKEEYGDDYFSSACLFKRSEGLKRDECLCGVSAFNARELSRLTVVMLSEYPEACQ